MKYKKDEMTGAVRKAGRKIGRNQMCSCGSKKTYKYCCGKASSTFIKSEEMTKNI